MKKLISLLLISLFICSNVFAGGSNPKNNPRYQYRAVDFVGGACKADGSVNWIYKDGGKTLNPPYRGFFKNKCNYDATKEPWPWEVGAYPYCYNDSLAVKYPGCSVQPSDG